MKQKPSAWDMRREAAEHLAHAASLVLEEPNELGKLAGAMLHCACALRLMVQADGRMRRAGDMALEYLAAVKEQRA